MKTTILEGALMLVNSVCYFALSKKDKFNLLLGAMWLTAGVLGVTAGVMHLIDTDEEDDVPEEAAE